jgi:hypothetical protein
MELRCYFGTVAAGFWPVRRQDPTCNLISNAEGGPCTRLAYVARNLLPR